VFSLLRIGLFRIVKWVKPGFLQTFIDIEGTELDSTQSSSCCLLREDIGPIRFGTMNDYCEVIARKCKIPDPSLAVD
jgi:hypothetical protein